MHLEPPPTGAVANALHALSRGNCSVSWKSSISKLIILSCRRYVRSWGRRMISRKQVCSSRALWIAPTLGSLAEALSNREFTTSSACTSIATSPRLRSCARLPGFSRLGWQRYRRDRLILSLIASAWRGVLANGAGRRPPVLWQNTTRRIATRLAEYGVAARQMRSDIRLSGRIRRPTAPTDSIQRFRISQFQRTKVARQDNQAPKGQNAAVPYLIIVKATAGWAVCFSK